MRTMSLLAAVMILTGFSTSGLADYTVYTASSGGLNATTGGVTTSIDTGDYTAVTTGYLDGDGDLDILAVKGGSVVWYENVSGSYQSRSVAALPSTTWQSVYLMDFDGDGQDDLFAGGVRYTEWMYGASDNTLGWKQHLIDNSAITTSTLTGGDYTGDGTMTVFTGGSHQLDRYHYEYSSGAGRYVAAWKQTVDSSDGWIGSAMGDVDQDGTEDLLAGRTGLAAIFQSVSATTSAKLQDIGTSSSRVYSDFAVGNVDGDSFMDILFTSHHPSGGNVGELTWFEMTAGGTAAWQANIATSQDFNAVTLWDVDGDGRDEILSGSDTALVSYDWLSGTSFAANTEATGTFNDMSIVPEPGCLGLLGLGAAGLLRKKRK